MLIASIEISHGLRAMKEKQPLTEGDIEAIITKRLLMFREVLVYDYGLKKVPRESPAGYPLSDCKADDEGERGLLRRVADIARY